jgi:hypothetical protein
MPAIGCRFRRQSAVFLWGLVLKLPYLVSKPKSSNTQFEVVIQGFDSQGTSPVLVVCNRSTRTISAPTTWTGPIMRL